MKTELIEKRQNNTLSVTSYNYDSLAHWFFYNHGHESTGQGRLSACGNDVISYSTTIGRLHQNKKVETSQEIKIDLRVAKATLFIWKKGKLSIGDKIQSYLVKNVSDYFVVIGCHRLSKEQCIEVLG